MYNILFSFLKPQLCYGGESTGGGGDGGSSDNGRGSSYGMEGAGDGAATSAGQARAAQLRAQAEIQRSVQQQARDNDRDRRTAVSKARSTGKTAAAIATSQAAAKAGDNNKNRKIASGLDSKAQSTLYDFANQFDPSKDMPGSPRNLQQEEDLQERMMRQNIAAAIDPYGQSTATDSNLTSRAVDMLNKGNMSKEQYEQSVKNLGLRLDQPRFGDSGLGKMFEASPLGQGLDYLGDMNQRRAYEKLTGQYEPGFLASVFTNYGDGERQVPVFDNGQVIGALGVDAAGNIINYTGEHSDTAEVFDETVDAQKAKDYTKVYDMGDPSRLDGSDNNDRQRAGAEDGEEGGAQEPTCPDGYIFDSEENACVLDPFQQPFPEAPTTGGGTYTAPALSPYTSVAPVTLPSLMPGQQQLLS